MSGFSADWLAAREAADGRSRSGRLVDTLPRRFPAIVDLGAGTGANLRWLAPRLDPGQNWILIDRDAGLLEAARAAIGNWAGALGYRTNRRGRELEISGSGFECRLATLELDLSDRLRDVELPAGCLVTASALLDLISGPWLEDLIPRLAASAASVLWTLSYDGSITLDPTQEFDDTIAALLNRHQLTDKGFGPALGPEAWRVARDLLAQAGFDVRAADSRWHCGAGDGALIRSLIEGWSEAAMAVAPADGAAIRTWCEQRLGQAAEGSLRVSVGHRDLAARPRAVPA